MEAGVGSREGPAMGEKPRWTFHGVSSLSLPLRDRYQRHVCAWFDRKMKRHTRLLYEIFKKSLMGARFPFFFFWASEC